MADPADQLVALYLRTARRLEAQIRAALRSDAIGTAAYRTQQLAAVRRLLDELGRASGPMTQLAIRRAYLEGALRADQALAAEPLAASAQGRFYGVHEAAVARYFGTLDNRLQLARATLGRQADDVFRRIGLEATSEGIAAGAARREVSAQIVAELEREGLTAFRDRRGRRWSLDTYAEMVARTTTREAVSQGTANRMLEHGADLATISSHANSCQICLPYQGNTYSLTGATPGYERIDRLPPFHPRCRHVLTPAADPDFEPPPSAEEPPAQPEPEPELGSVGDNVELGDEGSIAGVSPPVRAAAGWADEIHALPNIAAQIPVRMGDIPGSPGAAGAYLRSAQTGEPTDIKVKRLLGNQQAATFLHELGHYIDHAMIPGDRGDPLTPLAFASEAGNLDEVLGAINASAAAGRLRRIRAENQHNPAALELLDYLERPREQFARAYSQWILARGGHDDALDALRDGKVGHEQWDDADFAPIAAALQRLFERLGWLR